LDHHVQNVDSLVLNHNGLVHVPFADTFRDSHTSTSVIESLRRIFVRMYCLRSVEVDPVSLPYANSVILINFYNGFHFLNDYIIAMEDIWDLCHPGNVPLNAEERSEIISALIHWCSVELNNSKGKV